MDHVVYVDARAGELEKMLAGIKIMLVRGAAGRKLPHGRVQPGDRLFFIQNNGEGRVRASSVVTMVFQSPKLSPAESCQIIFANQDSLQLTPQEVQRWAGKRYLVLIGVDKIRRLNPFEIDRRGFGNMDDWLPVEDINRIKNDSKGD